MERERVMFVPGQQLPDINLPSAEGGTTRLSDYRQRRNLIVAFIGHAACEDFLRDLAQRMNDFDFEHTDVLAITRGMPVVAARLKQQFGLTFGVLADADGAAHRQVGAADEGSSCEPSVYILDRFGEIYATYPFGEDHAMPGAQQLLEWVQYIELQCPE